MIFTIAQDHVAFLGDCREGTLVGEEPGGKKEHGLTLQEISQRLLELRVQFQSSIEQPRPGTAGAIFSRRLTRGLDHALVLRETQVIV